RRVRYIVRAHSFFFSFRLGTRTTSIHTLSLHDALPIFLLQRGVKLLVGLEAIGEADDKGYRTVMATMNGQLRPIMVRDQSIKVEDRKSTRLNSSHVKISYAVFCLKKKKKSQYTSHCKNS